mgnify:CR=1 FL=1
MQSFGALSKPCSIHPENLLTGFCTFPACKQKVLCYECQNTHPKDHKKYFYPTLGILTYDSDAAFQEAKKRIEEYQTSFEENIKRLDEILTMIRKRFEEVLEEIRKKMIEDFKKTSSRKDIKVPSNATLNTLKEIFDKTREECLNYNGDHPEAIKHVRENFSDSFSEMINLRITIEELTGPNPKVEILHKFNTIVYTEEFAQHLRRLILNLGVKESKKPWRWGHNMKSPYIILENDGLTVRKLMSNYETALVFSTISMTEGRYEWKIFAKHQSKYVQFGIINARNTSAIDAAYCHATNGNGGILLTSKKEWNNQMHRCVLDFDDDSFRIYIDNEEIARKIGGIKGNSFFAFADCYDPEGIIRLGFD